MEIRKLVKSLDLKHLKVNDISNEVWAKISAYEVIKVNFKRFRIVKVKHNGRNTLRIINNYGIKGRENIYNFSKGSFQQGESHIYDAVLNDLLKIERYSKGLESGE